MRIEGLLFAFVALFVALCDIVYWFTSHDPTGTTALALTAGLGVIVGTYLLFTARRIDARPEDRPDADIAEGAGAVGFFSPYSWWPLPLAGSAALVALGIALGWWLVIIGVAFLFGSLGGLLFEYYVPEGDYVAEGEQLPSA